MDGRCVLVHLDHVFYDEIEIVDLRMVNVLVHLDHVFY